jgi:hypothetical protein
MNQESLFAAERKGMGGTVRSSFISAHNKNKTFNMTEYDGRSLGGSRTSMVFDPMNAKEVKGKYSGNKMTIPNSLGTKPLMNLQNDGKSQAKPD